MGADTVVFLHDGSAVCRLLASLVELRGQTAVHGRIGMPLDVESEARAIQVVVVRADRPPLWDAITTESESAPLVAIVSDTHPALYLYALAAGASGVVVAHGDLDRTMTVIDAAIHGDALMPVALTRELLSGESRLILERDRQVLRRLAEGHSVSELARQEHVSVSTARRMVVDLVRRMGSETIHEALVKAGRWGIVE